MEPTTITWLTADQIKILKYIVVVSDRNNQEIELGIIIYTREFNEQYNLIKQGEEDKTETDTFARLLGEYPKQKNYPCDDADLIILNAVRKQYPKSFVRNDTLFFNVDLEKLKVLKNRNVIQGAIYFSPEFSYTDIFKHVGQSFPAPRIDFNFYTNYGTQHVPVPFFYANYPAEDQKVLTVIGQIAFE
ncbi:hypothetical protein FPZ43_18010 [Mucilaginibacter pallidiroseus]|uniref:Uncharacterized protein n=1 Tax=Mucilaginibacter pallidiroseus TaxID=2599295 RepID=A0A563U1R7_9SPHI|nr:hypothetical protein [Mucilaginibacter pallidiroseus]TWR24791.1 hypothetical protein FPZ43_18010 [Mucilaginibacter pallidiroseus]